MKKPSLLIALAIALLSISPLTAANAACTSVGTGSVKVGSTVSGGSVVVCASTSTSSNTTATKKTVAVVKKAVTTVTKKVAAPVLTTATTPATCTMKITGTSIPSGLYLNGCTIILVPPVVATTKTVTATPKVTATVTPTVTNQSDQASFTPNPVAISSSSSSGVVGQAFIFSAVATSHSKSATILGKSATVSFTPIAYDWSSDSDSGSGSSFATSWSNIGTYSVWLSVTYSASYLLSGSTDWVSAGSISSGASASVKVLIGRLR